MAGNITVSSTTDSQEAVDAAAEYGQQTLPLTEEEKAGTSEVEETGTAADSEPAEEPENEEEGEEAEEQEEEPPEAASKPPGQTRRGLAAQIRRQAAELQELRELVRKHVPAEAQPAQQAKPDLPKRPDSGDPKYRGKQIEDVMEDMVEYRKAKDEQDKAVQQEAENQRQRTELATKVRDRYRQQAQAANQKYADFAELVNPLHPGALAEERIMVMSNGAEVAYHIAKNPDVLQQLVDWDVSGDPEDGNRIVQTLQNISDQLKGSGAASAPSPSQHRSPQPRPATPKPLRHVGGASTATTAPVDPGTMSMPEYKKWYRDTYGGNGR